MDAPLPRPKRVDALPEYIDYQDTGCDLYPSCLNCPLPRCRYDTPGGARAMLRVGRDAAIVAGYRRGKGVDDLARMFAVSRRTVFRVLQAARAAGQLDSRDVA